MMLRYCFYFGGKSYIIKLVCVYCSFAAQVRRTS